MTQTATAREMMIEYISRAVSERETSSVSGEGIVEVIGEVRQKVKEDIESYSAEKADTVKRFSDLEYQKMIRAKIDVLEMIGDDLPELPEEILREYLKEFTGDPVAMLAFFVITEGRSLETFKALSASVKEAQEQRSERLKEAFSQFESIMLRIGEGTGDTDPEIKASADDFVNWLRYQTDNWDRLDDEIRNEILNAGKKAESATDMAAGYLKPCLSN